MKNKNLLLSLGIIIIVVLIIIFVSSKGGEEKMERSNRERVEVKNTDTNMPVNNDPSLVTLVDGSNTITASPNQIVDLSGSTDKVKEVSMTSFSDMSGVKPAPQFSIKEITVKKGDKVKINVTVTAGKHNFNIDEYNIHKDTPLNTPVSIEFTADKVGKFIYYCSMPGHRALGHWGVLNVVE